LRAPTAAYRSSHLRCHQTDSRPVALSYPSVVTNQTPGVDDLVRQVEAAALSVGLPIRLNRGMADGFGIEQTTILDFSTPGSAQVIRLWEEGLGDFWIEVAGATAAWWRQGRKEATLAEVVFALIEGRFTVDDETVTVSPHDRSPLVLASRM
jgi:hypothetical protein